MAVTSLQELYLQKLQMIYDAEQQTLQAFPRAIQMAHNENLRNGLEAHRRQTEEQVRRLEGLFSARGQSPKRTESRSMRALLQEAEEVLPTIQDDDTRDAFIIAAQQAVEHHEIADYGTGRTWARQLGFDDDAAVLQEILDQERSADKLLSDVAERMVNPDAAAGTGDLDVTPRAQPGDRAADAGGRASSGGGARTTGDGGAIGEAEPSPLNR
jgi:ferritin-like metal-binding protein YciE